MASVAYDKCVMVNVIMANETEPKKFYIYLETSCSHFHYYLSKKLFVCVVDMKVSGKDVFHLNRSYFILQRSKIFLANTLLILKR